jgi:hypothetical protein
MTDIPRFIENRAGVRIDISNIEPGGEQAKALVTEQALLIEEDLTRLCQFANALGCWDVIQALIDRCSART